MEGGILECGRGKDSNFWRELKEWEVVVMSETWIEEKGWEKVKSKLMEGYKWGMQFAKKEV